MSVTDRLAHSHGSRKDQVGRCADGRHRMHVPPGQPPPAPIDGCDRPLRLVCGYCGHTVVVRCRSSRSRCAPCSDRYRRNVARVARSGMSGRVLLPGQLYSLTLTAPGAREHALPGRSIPCPCSARLLADEIDMAVWNGDAVHRWNRLHQALERRLGVTLKYFKVVEVQKRGALHLHVVIRVDRACEIRVSALRGLAIRHGFGHSVDLQKLTGSAAERACWYVAKYVSKSSDDRGEAPYVNRRTGEFGHGKWRTWTSSREWGETMSSIRAAQLAWIREGGSERTQGAGAAEPTGACGGEAAALDRSRARYASVVVAPLATSVPLPM
jgi:hypothetical protein